MLFRSASMVMALVLLTSPVWVSSNAAFTIWVEEPSTGEVYRPATAMERASNGWPAETYLVEKDSLDDGAGAVATVPLIVPTSATTAEVLDLGFIETDVRDGFGYAHVDSGASGVRSLTMHRYLDPAEHAGGPLPPGYDGPVAGVTVTAAGTVLGEVWLDGDNVRIYPLQYNWMVEPILTASGRLLTHDDLYLVIPAPSSQQTGGGEPAPCNSFRFICQLIPVTIWECNDGKDNDADGLIDYPEDPGCDEWEDNSELEAGATITVSTVPEAKWCTARGEDAADLWMDSMIDQIESLFEDNDETRVTVHDGSTFCVFAASFDAAKDCDQNGGCTLPGCGGVSYYYNGANSNAETYKDQIPTALSTIRNNCGTSFASSHIVFVAHQGRPLFGGSAFCGGTDESWRGRLVVIGAPIPMSASCADFVWSHEAGHVFGGAHSLAETSPPTIMVTSDDFASRNNEFSEENRVDRVIPCAMDEGNSGCHDRRTW